MSAGGAGPGAGGSSAGASRSLDFILRELFTAALGVLGIYISSKIMKRVLDPNAAERERMKGRRDAVISRLKRAGVPSISLTSLSSAEEALLYEIVFPEDISASFHNIGGLRNIKEAVKELIVYPLMYPDVFRPSGMEESATGALLAPPKGVLLYGPPGTGKTMLAKALAKESGAIFLALSPSSLLSKWLGETEQFARAVFTLAKRVQPSIVFIDEIDGLFRERSSTEHEAHKNLKAEFMQLWDGLTTDDRSNQVIVLGATNRPYDVDPAILRRMPRAFEVALPDKEERVAILKTILKGVSLQDPFDFAVIADVTPGYSGSDLKELCRAAMMQPLREALREANMRRTGLNGLLANAPPPFQSAAGNSGAQRNSTQGNLRPLSVNDVLVAKEEAPRTEEQSSDYMFRSANAAQSQNASATDLQPFLSMLRAFAAAGRSRSTA